MSEKNGGPAFPVPGRGVSESGMTLRDYFAAKALAGILGSYSGMDGQFPTARSAASLAYEMADAMLRAREETPR